ncbi:uncharacterized protein LOC132702447 [Cylas formicarius]|uniref:uncharacterized protein LOC132702447 n=1 Tax=Cylas formicarius TaxID=197179 RepID=UPI00295844F3|nr:uncharacterized protein LOC132702447 [Cylas formicarius]
MRKKIDKCTADKPAFEPECHGQYLSPKNDESGTGMDLKTGAVGYFGRYVLVFCLSLVIFASYTLFSNSAAPNYILSENSERAARINTGRYLIKTSKCKIPDLDPYNRDVAPFVKSEPFLECSALPLLTYIEKTGDSVKLKVNRSVIAFYTLRKISCCYSIILRRGDVNVTHSKCRSFRYETEITEPYIRVTCSNFYGVVYRNVHAAVIPTKLPEHRIKTRKRPSMILMGIDSMSKLNLARAMPKTREHLETNYVNLKGYNKIGDNTYPNLIAVLTGRSMRTLGTNCKIGEFMDDCDLIWRRYRDNGYVTAYAEDEVDISTFNFVKPGFIRPPTDFYYRPYFLSAHKLPIQRRYSMSVCTGPENSGVRVLDLISDFVKSVTDSPKFGLFWMNSFSHDNVNFASSMDDKVSELLIDLNESLRDSFVVVFSDHGFRFGDIRFTYTGWLEERLPFIYVKLPQNFDPVLSRRFASNAFTRLTTPYDFYMTLQHMLKLSNDSYEIEASVGCPGCRSLFETIPENRTCADAGIEQHWCTCHGHTYLDTDLKVVQDAAGFVVGQINEVVSEFNESDSCARYRLRSVSSAGMSQKHDEDDVGTSEYLVLLETDPPAMFEATVERRGSDSRFKLLGAISRLNRYKEYSSCVEDKLLKKYCYCNGIMTRLKSTICKLFKYC